MLPLSHADLASGEILQFSQRSANLHVRPSLTSSDFKISSTGGDAALSSCLAQRNLTVHQSHGKSNGFQSEAREAGATIIDEIRSQIAFSSPDYWLSVVGRVAQIISTSGQTW